MNIFENWSSLSICRNRNKVFSCYSLLKWWYLKSTCLVVFRNSGFPTNRIAPWLATYTVGWSLVILSLLISSTDLKNKTEISANSLAEMIFDCFCLADCYYGSPLRLCHDTVDNPNRNKWLWVVARRPA